MPDTPSSDPEAASSTVSMTAVIGDINLGSGRGVRIDGDVVAGRCLFPGFADFSEDGAGRCLGCETLMSE